MGACVYEWGKERFTYLSIDTAPALHEADEKLLEEEVAVVPTSKR